jgi:hypothetical protein
MWRHLLELPERQLYWLEASEPAVYLLVDRQAEGALINAPPYSDAVRDAATTRGPLKYLFLPSRLGATDVDLWREQAGLETMAFADETPAIEGTIDLPLDRKSKLTRTIDFLPLPGRTAGTCAMRLKNKPGVVFFGPALEPDATGWPALRPMPDDLSYENRVIGALGLQDLRFEYAFTDRYDPATVHMGPGADQAIQSRLGLD